MVVIKKVPHDSILIIRDDPKKVLDLEFKLISSAVSTIELTFSSINVFRNQQRLGTIDALEDVLTKNKVIARILMPIADGYDGEDFQMLEKIDGLDIRYFNYNSDIRNKTLIVDRAESLVIEINEEEARERKKFLDGENDGKALDNATSKTMTEEKEEKSESKPKQL
jgi:hypothetical protein